MTCHLGKRLSGSKESLWIAAGVLACASFVTILFDTPSLIAQSQATGAARSPAFEVASIKSNKSVSTERGSGFQTNGRFFARNMPLRALIAIAYGEPAPLPGFQIVAGPDWIDSDRFDIEAKAEGSFPETGAEAGFSTSGELMLQALLIERFKLIVHRETRQLPTYELVMAKSDRRLGSQLRPSSGADCAQAPPAGGPPAAPDPNALPRCGVFQYVGGTAGTLLRARGRFMTMDQLAKNLENTLRRPIANRTELSGGFSFDFEFIPIALSAAPDVGASDAATSIFSALQEQLGLELESSRAPVNVIVVDRAERPTPD